MSSKQATAVSRMVRTERDDFARPPAPLRGGVLTCDGRVIRPAEGGHGAASRKKSESSARSVGTARGRACSILCCAAAASA